MDLSIRARWLSRAVLALIAVPAIAAAQSPAALVRAYRESPAPARRVAVERYAAGRAGTVNGALARLALGVTAFEQKDWPAAIENLRLAGNRPPQLADYVAFHLTAARLEAKDPALDAGALAAVYNSRATSPLAGRALVLDGRARLAANSAKDAIRVLNGRYSELPQPEGDMALAMAHEAAGDLPRAALSYQQVYYKHPLAPAAAEAEAALAKLRAALGDAYPPPPAPLMLARADKLLEGRAWARARDEYRSLASQLGGPEGDLARVRIGAADYQGGNTTAADRHLRSLTSRSGSEADAERLYYLVECARRLGKDDEMAELVRRLERSYPESPWRLKALVSAGNRYLLVNEPGKYLPFYRAAYESFPASAEAAYCHWKVAWNSYMQRKGDAGSRMRAHVEKFPSHATASAALYFLGRLAERDSRWGEARAWYTALADLFPNYYYGLQARERLAGARVASAAPNPEVPAFLNGISFPPRPRNTPVKPEAAAALRIERARLLRSAGLDELAGAELRFGSRAGEQPTLLAVEATRGGAAPHEKLRLLKGMQTDYLAMGIEQAPAAYWENLFPLPFRNELVRSARQNNLDPLKVAALIRQESEFNPQAVSRARAHGLTQVMPGTGRQLARKAGIRRFQTGMLFQPSINLKLGALYMRQLLDKWGGSWEETLASYNAGPNRVTEWAAWHTYEEPSEFIETIPFTETREYVKAVLRNAAMYRRIYQDKPSHAAVGK